MYLVNTAYFYLVPYLSITSQVIFHYLTVGNSGRLDFGAHIIDKEGLHLILSMWHKTHIVGNSILRRKIAKAFLLTYKK